MTNIDLDALQALAERATPGKRSFSRESWNIDVQDSDREIGVYIPEDEADMTGEFVAACDPQTILSLIARIRELEGDTSKSAAGRTLAKADIEYPRDVFSDLILNNSPYAFYLFQWVPYQTDAKRWRLKMCHDVRTFDGREAHGIWPNGSHCGPFRDDEVEFIRISRSQYGEAWEDPRHAAPSAGRAAPEGIPYRATVKFDHGEHIVTGVIPDVAPEGGKPDFSKFATLEDYQQAMREWTSWVCGKEGGE